MSNDDPEWTRMWAALKATGEDIDAFTDGQAWQYMGSVRDPEFGPVHQFRHRVHPSNGMRASATIRADPVWSEGRDLPVWPPPDDESLPF